MARPLSRDKFTHSVALLVGEFVGNSEQSWVALVARVEALERKLERGQGK
jgi:hypothetical protein